MIKDKDTFFKSGWRPSIGWAFVLIIIFDFVIAPVITFMFIKMGLLSVVWVPLTTDASGFFYICMGTILGVTSYSRGLEKIKKMEIESTKSENE